MLKKNMLKNIRISRKLMLAFAAATLLSMVGGVIGCITIRAANAGMLAVAVIVAVLIFSTALSIVLASIISHGISKAMGDLAMAADKVAEGDLRIQLNSDSIDEIGRVASSFSKSITSIHSYIDDITETLSKVEKGDLSTSLGKEYKGDFVGLKKSIRGIVFSLNNIILLIRQASDQVSAGSEQLSNSSQALAQGATEQASSMEALATTIAEISSQVQKNTEHVQTANSNAEAVTKEIESCNEYMQNMVQAMSQISESSNQIGIIIQTIDGLAFQTNILALNAAVEAAHAGEAGKGFAVVADEVRNLASKSAAASKDTAQLIQTSIDQVNNGTKIADRTAKSLLRVVESAKAVFNSMGHISEATQAQARSISQVNIGMEQISSVVQTNSATAEESAAASEELSGQAQTLSCLVKEFKLRPEFEEQVQ